MNTFFPLSWHIDDEEIQVFGWSRHGSSNVSTCLRIVDFQPYMYLKLPDMIKWTQDKCALVIKALRTKKVPIEKATPARARGLYSNVLDPKTNYILVSFRSEADREEMKKSLYRPMRVLGIGDITLKCYEHNASPILQLICRCNISTAHWFNFTGQIAEEPISTCPREYTVSWTQLRPTENADSLGLPSPLIMGYDIETYSHDPARFCDPDHPEDVIFQISMVFGVQGSDTSAWEKYILSLGQPALNDPDINVMSFKSEKAMLLAYAQLVSERKPDVLMGYNTFGFDNRYMLARAKLLMIHDEFVRHGCTFEKAESLDTQWSSSAYGVQKIYFLDTKGRVHIDLLLLVAREYKLDNYKLGTVAQHFLGRTKDPLTHYDIHDAYKIGISLDSPSRELGMVARYCVKDSVLVVELFEHLKFWYSLMAMAKICCVPMAYLFQRGQQIKVFSQVYRYCYDNNIVVENNSFKPGHDDIVQGAFVLDAVRGLHKNVVSFDFASLYPSIIISHNIDYGTLVKPTNDIEDEKCHIIEWEEHFGCECPGAEKAKKIKGETLVVCARRYVRWLKEPAGVLPTIIQRLLTARKEVRAKMESIPKESTEYMIAHQLQNAFKVSANSAYGVLASSMGPLLFPVGGMCVTAIGRRSLRKVKSLMETKYNASVVYGDTDSVYVIFRGVPLNELEAFCLKTAAAISAEFPRPMKLEYENKIYRLLLLLTKKRYVFMAHGKTKIDFKGILLKRRDSSPLIRDIYKRILMLIIEKEASREELERAFFEELAILCSGCSNPERYVISSSIKDIDSFSLKPKSAKKMQYGSYTVSKVSDDPKKRALQFKKKGVSDEESFYRASLPGHVQLALRMRERGQTIQSGARLSMLYTKRGGIKAPGYYKLEEIEYFGFFYDRKFIDTLHYTTLLLTPMEELFTAYFRESFSLFFKGLLKTCIAKAAVLEQFKRLTYPVRMM
jgi:DNA polymerase elongation subunit (family B)